MFCKRNQDTSDELKNKSEFPVIVYYRNGWICHFDRILKVRLLKFNDDAQINYNEKSGTAFEETIRQLRPTDGFESLMTVIMTVP
jgi:hypothetical protein